MRWARHRLALVLMGALGCGDDEGNETGNESGNGSGTSIGTTSTGAAESSGSPTAGGGSTTTGDDGSSTADGTAGASCGDVVCTNDQVCVHPCCGGELPGCYAGNPDGTCNGVDTPVDPGMCRIGCEVAPCCMEAPCTPPPSYCVDSTQLSCQGEQCNVDDCFGYLDGVDLSCACA